MVPTYRFYSFVAGLYLSQLQRGLQTAHAVSEMHTDISRLKLSTERGIFDKWAESDKTIVICDAGNHQGVSEASFKAQYFASALALPATIFHEDEQSMNGMATAAAIIVPDVYFDVVMSEDKKAYVHTSIDEVFDVPTEKIYPIESFEGDFISWLKSYRLAQS